MMGSGGSKEEEKVIKVDGVNEYDQSMSIVLILSISVNTFYQLILSIQLILYIQLILSIQLLLSIS